MEKNKEYYYDYMNFFVNKYNNGERSFYIDDTDYELINTFVAYDYEWLAALLTNYPNDIDKTNVITLQKTGYKYYYYVSPFKISDKIIASNIKQASSRIIDYINEKVLINTLYNPSYKKILDDFLTGKNDDIFYITELDNVNELIFLTTDDCTGNLLQALLPYCVFDDYYFHILCDVCDRLDSLQKKNLINSKDCNGVPMIYKTIKLCGFSNSEKVFNFLIDIPELDINIILPNGKTFLTSTLIIEMMYWRFEEFHKKLIIRSKPYLTYKQKIYVLNEHHMYTALTVMNKRFKDVISCNIRVPCGNSYINIETPIYVKNILYTLDKATQKQGLLENKYNIVVK